MRRYIIFGLRTFGFTLATLLVVALGALGINAVGNWPHHDFGTADRASGAAAGIVNWHDTLVKRLNKNVDSDEMSYKAALAYGSNNYTFFDQSSVCKIGQGYVFALGILQSKKYIDSELAAQVKNTLDSNAYTYTVNVKREETKTAYNFRVTNGKYVTEISVYDYNGEYKSLGSSVLIRTDDNARNGNSCYPMNTLPRPHLDKKYL